MMSNEDKLDRFLESQQRYGYAVTDSSVEDAAQVLMGAFDLGPVTARLMAQTVLGTLVREESS